MAGGKPPAAHAAARQSRGELQEPARGSGALPLTILYGSQTGKDFDQRLKALGATPFLDRVDWDVVTNINPGLSSIHKRLHQWAIRFSDRQCAGKRTRGYRTVGGELSTLRRQVRCTYQPCAEKQPRRSVPCRSGRAEGRT